MAGITSALSDALDVLTSNPKLVDQISSTDPLFEVVSKKKGKANPLVVVEASLNAGVSPDAAIAEADAANGEDAAFNLTYTELYGALSLKYLDTLTNTDGSEGLVRHLERQMMKMLRRLMRQQVKYFYRDSSGSLGVISAVGASDITLATANDVRNFQKNDKIEFHTAAAGGALRDAGDTLTVQSVDETNGTITFTTATSNITGLAVNDHVGLRGSRNAAPVGLQDWIVSTADTLYGEDRTQYDKTAVCGTITDQSAETVAYEQARLGINEILKADEWSSKKKCLIVNPDFWSSLSADIESLEVHKVPTNYSKGASAAGHSALYWLQAGCEVEIMSSVHVPGNKAFVLDPSAENLELLFMAPGGKMVAPIETRSGDYFTRSGSSLTAMMHLFTALAMNAPRKHGIITLS